jgi:DNA primase
MTTYPSLLAKLSGVHEYAEYATALCPVHGESNPSLFIYQDGFCYCMSCGWKGSWSKLEKELKGYVAPAVVQTKVSHAHNLSSDLVECEQQCDDAHKFLLEKFDPLAHYLIQRKVQDRIVPQGIGYFDGWYSIPVYDREHKFIGAVQRASPAKQSETGLRFSTPKDQKPLVYVPDWKRVDESEYLCVVYGMFDALSLCEMGLPVVTPTAGKNSMHPDMLEWCRKTILIMPDKGEEDTGIQLLRGLGWRGKLVHLRYPDSCKDPADMFQQNFGDIIIKQIEEVL